MGANFFAGDPEKKTNPIARKLLGECGFIHVEDHPTKTPGGRHVSTWSRKGESILLFESQQEEPWISTPEGAIIDWRTLGPRNQELAGEEQGGER